MSEPAKRSLVNVSQQWLGPASYASGPNLGQFIKDKTLDVSFMLEGKTYRVLLHAANSGHWIGTQTVAGGRPESVEGKLYTAEDGEMVLIGQWYEKGFYTWIVHISLEE